MGDVIGGDLLATEAGSVDVNVELDAFQGVVKLDGNPAEVAAPSTCYGAACKTSAEGGGFYVGSRDGCDGTDDWDCTYQRIDATASGRASVTAACDPAAGDGCA